MNKLRKNPKFKKFISYKNALPFPFHSISKIYYFNWKRE